MKMSVLLAGTFFPRLSSSVALLESDGRHILVDTSAAERAGALLAALAGHGLGPKDVDAVLTTHLHYDHCGNHLLFPNARYLASADDYADTATFISAYHADNTSGKDALAELLRTKHQVIKDYYLRSMVREVGRNLDFYNLVLAGDPRFLLLSGSHWLTDEIEVVPTPGHTRGHVSAVAHGALRDDHGALLDLLVAGDALPTRVVMAEGGDREIHVAADTTAYRRTRRALLERYRFIVPGHDALVDTRSSVSVEAAVSLSAGLPG